VCVCRVYVYCVCVCVYCVCVYLRLCVCVCILLSNSYVCACVHFSPGADDDDKKRKQQRLQAESAYYLNHFDCSFDLTVKVLNVDDVDFTISVTPDGELVLCCVLSRFCFCCCSFIERIIVIVSVAYCPILCFCCCSFIERVCVCVCVCVLCMCVV